jgi:hypothetical protein
MYVPKRYSINNTVVELTPHLQDGWPTQRLQV